MILNRYSQLYRMSIVFLISALETIINYLKLYNMKNLVYIIGLLLSFNGIAQTEFVPYEIQFDKPIVDCAVMTFQNGTEASDLGSVESIIDSKISLKLVPGREYRILVNNTDVIDISSSDIENRMMANRMEGLSQGVMFSIQVGAFEKGVPNNLDVIDQLIIDKQSHSLLTRCLSGVFLNPEDALNELQLLKDKGFVDAFPVAYKNGERINFTEGVLAIEEISAK